VGGDREAQDDVPQEGEPLVRALALVDPGGVRERLRGEVVGKLIEKVAKRFQGCQDAFCGACAAM
jgi:hypothetical protein